VEEIITGDSGYVLEHVPAFTSLQELRFDKVPKWDGIDRDGDVDESKLHVSDRHSHILARLGTIALPNLQTLEMRPKYPHHKTGMFPSNWPALAPTIPTLRVPFRNFFEALVHIKPSHNIEIQVLMSDDNFHDHHKFADHLWVCGALKLLSELAHYFSITDSEHRSILFSRADIDVNYADWYYGSFVAGLYYIKLSG
jgi:hypothetical protein